MLHRVALVRTESLLGYITSFLRSGLRLLVTANVVSSSPIPVTLMMEAICSYETSVLPRTIRRYIAEDAILPFTIL
jgi:hypothetical protein